MNLAESHDLPGIAGVACFFLGVHWKDQMEYALSEHFTQRSISAFERGGLSDYAERARYRLFTLYRRRGDLSQALEQHEALAPSRRNDVRFLADSARLFIMLRQPERAAQVFASMPAVTGQRIESRVQAIILALRSDLFAQNGDHEEALRIVEIALDRARAIADPSPLVGEILIRRAYLFHALERYEDAEFQIEDAHRVCTETNEFFGFGLIQRLQGLLAKQKMKYKLAEMLLEQSARFFESRGELFECANSYSTLSEFYNRRQEKKALESGVQALALYLKIGAEVQSAEMREKLHNMAMLSSQPSPSIARLKDHERDLIESVLEECSGNISHAAQVLGISRSKIYRRLKKR
ncbi:MAG: tetratricopeptide repeat protein [bacterium]|nr:tetratricopeptide repeat protein [bacterium]